MFENLFMVDDARCAQPELLTEGPKDQTLAQCKRGINKYRGFTGVCVEYKFTKTKKSATTRTNPKIYIFCFYSIIFSRSQIDFY